MPGKEEEKQQQTILKQYLESAEAKQIVASEVRTAVEGYLNKMADLYMGAEEPQSVDDTDENKPDVVIQQTNTSLKPSSIRRVSEKLNDDDRRWQFQAFSDTRTIIPGMVVYVIEKIKPTDLKPYVTYKPAQRIIVEVQDNGVNNGTVFLSYAPKVVAVATYHSKQHNAPTVIAETDVIYSPLTKAHAEYVCKLLNLQSKQVYKNHMTELAKQQKTR